MNTNYIVPFILASVAIICPPGPSVTFLISTSMVKGKKVAYQVIPGIFFGDLLAMFLSFLGIGVLIRGIPLMEGGLKVVGGAYLIYLGVKTFISRKTQVHKEDKINSIGFKDGFLLELTNPKTLLFFVTFFPQFIDQSHSYWGQLILLGIIFLSIGLINDFTYSTFANLIGKYLSDKLLEVVPKIGGAIMIVSAIFMFIK